MKTANKNENGDEIYETLKTVLNQGHEKHLKHTVEVRLLSHNVNPEKDDLYHEVWVDGQLTETSRKVDDPQRAYMRARRAWRLAITDILNKNWPLPEFEFEG